MTCVVYCIVVLLMWLLQEKVDFSSVMSETWRAGCKLLLEGFGEEVEVFTAMKRNRHFHLTGLAELVGPLQQRWTEQIHVYRTDYLKKQ